ncbi:hypothetical protein DID88_006200 [Monilinia fructigena]|uniref:LicD/FKTN/FKRP nucleotidyltransferase domain-containing protein n=1 Tax=Monilinia fructigena TaxID=38457 RepID=A0A395J206_9HELO|nr:hypothetical protein DID88_006200 [Monilinia fructigena]
MPWDWDLDTQVSSATLAWLGENMNMTTHNYTGRADDGSSFTREYLLDVNPWNWERVRGDGMNVIDARWIDVRNGLFIDITGLAEVNPSTQPGVWSCKNYHRYRTRDLYPLRETDPRALTKTLHEGHRWIPEQKEWIPEKPIGIHENGNEEASQAQPQDQNQAQPQKQEQKQEQKQDHPHMPRSIQSDEKPQGWIEESLECFVIR